MTNNDMTTIARDLGKVIAQLDRTPAHCRADLIAERDALLLLLTPWCQTHALNTSTDGLVPSTHIDPFGRAQCCSHFRMGQTLRGDAHTCTHSPTTAPAERTCLSCNGPLSSEDEPYCNTCA